MTATDQAHLNKIEAFIREIGIDIHRLTLSQDTFLPGILIEQGKLLVDQEKLLYPGDLLHEAGHIAVTPPVERPLLGGNVTVNNPQKEGDEIAVLLWTYAACRQIDLAPSVVFHPMGYKGQSDWLIERFEQKKYIGLPLLVWMQMTTADEFPIMQHWMR